MQFGQFSVIYLHINYDGKMLLLMLQDDNRSWQLVKVRKCIRNCQSLKKGKGGQIWTKEASNDLLERALPGTQRGSTSVPTLHVASYLHIFFHLPSCQPWSSFNFITMSRAFLPCHHHLFLLGFSIFLHLIFLFLHQLNHHFTLIIICLDSWHLCQAQIFCIEN